MNCCNSCACERCIHLAHMKARNYDIARTRVLKKKQREREREIRMMHQIKETDDAIHEYIFGGKLLRHIIMVVVLATTVIWIVNMPDAAPTKQGYDYDKYFR